MLFLEKNYKQYNKDEETLFLNAIPSMASSIKEAMEAPNSEFSEDMNGSLQSYLF